MSQMLFKYPGSHFLHEIPCDYCIVEEFEIEEKMKSGEWHMSPADAKAAHDAKQKPKPSAVKTKKKVAEE